MRGNGDHRSPSALPRATLDTSQKPRFPPLPDLSGAEIGSGNMGPLLFDPVRSSRTGPLSAPVFFGLLHTMGKFRALASPVPSIPDEYTEGKEVTRRLRRFAIFRLNADQLTRPLIIINLSVWNMERARSNWRTAACLSKSGSTAFVIGVRRRASSPRSVRCRSGTPAAQNLLKESQLCLSIASTPGQGTGYITGSVVERWSCCGAVQSAPKR